MKPITNNYNGRNFLVLPPGIWSDIIADEFWRQYRMPCAFSFKKQSVSREDFTPFIQMIGKCKSKECNNSFSAFVNEEPIDGADFWLQRKCCATRLDEDHEEIKRELRFQQRQDIGKVVLKEGAKGTRRKIALDVQTIGDFPAPNLYKGEVLRKLLQECKGRELNVNASEGTNPINIFMLLKYRPPYFGSIALISADKFQLQYLLPEQRFIFKEYCRLFSGTSTICIWKWRNFSATTVSVGQMLSAAQDTNSILFWQNNWLKAIKTIPRQAVSDYSKALLGAMSLAFNNMSLNTCIQTCFECVTKEKIDRPANSFLRIDVAHLIQIFSRLKYFTKCFAEVKDYYLRCIALMVSSDSLQSFESILYNTFVVSIHKCDGNKLNRFSPSPAEAARQKLEQLIKEESHFAMKLIPSKDSDEFKNSIKKLYASGLNPIDPECFLNQEADVDQTILEWLNKIQLKAQINKEVEHSRINAYFIPGFFNHLLKLAKEFPLWTGTCRKNFTSLIIRPTRCYVESEFGELKHNILNKAHGPLRTDKFFKIHFEALKAQILIASAEISKMQMRGRTKAKPNIPFDEEYERLVVTN